MVQRVDRLASTPPAFEIEAARQILRTGFGVEAPLTPLAGERDQNFRADTRDGPRFLLKISNPADGRDVLEMQAAALRHIGQVDPDLPVMRALPAATGEPWVEITGPEGRTFPVRLFTFLPGRVTATAALTTPAIRSFGQVTARLGRALRGFIHPAADYEILWDLTHALKLRPLLTHLSGEARRAQVARVLDRFETRVAPALPGLRAQVIHADMSLDNVLFDGDSRISGIVDFGDMTHAPLVCDLAVAIVQPAQERSASIELVTEVFVPGINAVIGHPTQHRMADIGRAAVLDDVADGIATAGIADQRHARRTGPLLQRLDRLGKLAALILDRGAVRLRHRVVIARQGIGEVDGEHPIARHAVRLHPP